MERKGAVKQEVQRKGGNESAWGKTTLEKNCSSQVRAGGLTTGATNDRSLKTVK